MQYFRCHCGYCDIMPTSGECICCCEVEEVMSKLEETGASCITEQEGFGTVCLNRWVLLFNIDSNMGMILMKLA